MAMPRRLAFIFLLMASFAAALPVASACASMTEQRDCCPDKKPCNPRESEQLAIQTAACCVVGQTQGITTSITSTAQKDDPSRAAADRDEPSWTTPAVVAAHRSLAPPAVRYSPSAHHDGQLVYLFTGRLRL